MVKNVENDWIEVINFQSHKEEIHYVSKKLNIDQNKIFNFLGLSKNELNSEGNFSDIHIDKYERRISCLLNEKNFTKPSEYMIDYINTVFIETLKWDTKDLSNYIEISEKTLVDYLNNEVIPNDDEKLIILRVMSLGRGLM